MDNLPYQSLNAEYRRIFGKKTAKISLDGGFSCPNRDGTLGTGGCLFCSGDGSGDFAAPAVLSIREQVKIGKAQTLEKWPDACYIAYFQAFTNTYAPVARLRQAYQEALEDRQVVGLSIATRPDCLDQDVLALLAEFSQKTRLWVELGFQTANEATAVLIRRGYLNRVLEEAVFALAKENIPVVVHIILGLPEETDEEVLATIDYINALPVNGVKLHLMHVLKGTDLATLYESGAYEPMTKEAYLSLLCRCIARLRKDIVIHRLTGDGDKNLLLSPFWSLHKRDVLNSLHKALRQNEIRQGQDFHGASDGASFCPLQKT